MSDYPNEELRILVTGGRDFEDYDRLSQCLDGVIQTKGYCHEGRIFREMVTIVHGAQPTGADALAHRYAQERLLQVLPFPAAWEDFTTPPVLVRRRRNGTKFNILAGKTRNQRMLDESEPQIVVICPGGNGTADCTKRAKKRAKVFPLEIIYA